jgi:hypothetical protein
MKVKPIDATCCEQGEDALRNVFDNAPRSMPTPHQAEPSPARPGQKTNPMRATTDRYRTRANLFPDIAPLVGKFRRSRKRGRIGREEGHEEEVMKRRS